MKAAATSNKYLDFLVEQFAPMGEIEGRPMMGGYTLYCNRVPFALVAKNALYLKADNHNRPEFVARGLRAFQPFADSPCVLQYYAAPAEIFEDPEALRHWAGGSIAAGQRAQAKRKPRKKVARAS